MAQFSLRDDDAERLIAFLQEHAGGRFHIIIEEATAFDNETLTVLEDSMLERPRKLELG